MISGGVDTSAPLQGIKRMRKRASNLSPAMKAVRGPVRKDMRDHGTKAEGPDGRWPRRPRLKRGARRRRAPRKLLGRLTTSIKITTLTSNTLEVTSLIPWSDIHQKGGRVGRGVTLPKRTFLWFSKPVLYKLRQEVLKHMTVGW